jgi:isoleucyl-tRNA synthetase
MFKKGLVHRGLKPVYWSPSSRTALAEAELEYAEDHTSTSIIVAFPVGKLSPAAERSLGRYSWLLRALAWTTTPWTIPANVALAINENLTYAVVGVNGFHYLVALDRLQALNETIWGGAASVKCSFSGKDLLGSTFLHPLTKQPKVVISADYVNTVSGTGVVHVASAHGHEDFAACRKNDIQEIITVGAQRSLFIFHFPFFFVFSPFDESFPPPVVSVAVNGEGKFTKDAGPQLAGLEVLGEGNEAVIAALEAKECLIAKQPIQHRYPYDWRTKKPVIIR